MVGTPGNLPLCPILICQASSNPENAPATSCTPSCCTHRCSRSSLRNVLLALLGMLPWNSLTLVLTRYWALSLLFMPFALCSPLGSLCYPRYQHSTSHLWQGWCPWSYTGHSLCSICDRPHRRTVFPFLTPSPSSVSRALVESGPTTSFPVAMLSCEMLILLPSCSRSTQSRRSRSQHPWWSWRSCQEVSSLSLSHLPRSRRRQRAVNLPPSTGESLLSPHLL